jgi:hypothetical protein
VAVLYLVYILGATEDIDCDAFSLIVNVSGSMVLGSPLTATIYIFFM